METIKASNGVGHDAVVAIDAVNAVRLQKHLRLRVSSLRGRSVNMRRGITDLLTMKHAYAYANLCISRWYRPILA
jgi:hypothetical protein